MEPDSDWPITTTGSLSPLASRLRCSRLPSPTATGDRPFRFEPPRVLFSDGPPLGVGFLPRLRSRDKWPVPRRACWRRESRPLPWPRRGWTECPGSPSDALTGCRPSTQNHPPAGSTGAFSGPPLRRSLMWQALMWQAKGQDRTRAQWMGSSPPHQHSRGYRGRYTPLRMWYAATSWIENGTIHHNQITILDSPSPVTRDQDSKPPPLARYLGDKVLQK